MEQKSYNIQALRGHDYSDQQFQQDMADAGLNIPDNMLYKPELNDFVLQAMYEQNIDGLQTQVNPRTGVNYTAKEATEEARQLRKQASSHVDTLMQLK
jgi:hypothetical protein